MWNKKGFTLIELLAVIVILGLLLAIAIPSITKYIVESRKKTVVSSIDGYMSSVIASVNNQEYNFTTPNTIYALPIECISLEKGGKNPLGEWIQSNKNYWAYVLVQYDSETLSYDYGFTFKDSAGYGMYPTIQSHINEKGMQIQTNLEIERPKNGSIEKVTIKSNWNGFNINDDTQLKVLRATIEHEIGDGKNTCTLVQKGSNYEQVQEEIKDLILVKYAENKYFWEYREQIKNITFEDSINVPDDAYKSWDVSETGKGKVMAYIIPNSIDSSFYDLYIQGDGEIYANSNSSYLFYKFKNVDSINNMKLFNTSNATNMAYMFRETGYNSTVFTLKLGDKFDTSNVTNMGNMFQNTGYSSTVFTLDLGDKFDTSKVTNMSGMFSNTGYNSAVFTLDLGDKFDTSNVTNMGNMFEYTGYSSTKLTLDLGDKFDTSNVTNMGNMFNRLGRSSSIFTLDLGDKFDTSNVTNMGLMFVEVGRSSPIFTLNLGNKFDTSKVSNMGYMFHLTGQRSSVFTLDLGYKFDTSSVTNMQGMFWGTGQTSSLFKIDCSNWTVDKVTSYDSFNTGVTTKVIAPTWVN